MDSLISICRWISKALTLFLSVATGLVGLFVSMFFALGSFASAVYSDLGGICTSVITFLHTCSDYVQAFMEFLSSSEYYPLFYHILAIDKLGELIVLLLGVFLTTIFFLVVGLFSHCAVLIVPFIGFRISTKVISLCSAGILKP